MRIFGRPLHIRPEPGIWLRGEQNCHIAYAASSRLELRQNLNQQWSSADQGRLNHDGDAQIPLPPAPFPEAFQDRVQHRAREIWAHHDESCQVKTRSESRTIYWL
jgi:hypothetical protein